jgi:hypothetical protein
MSDFMAFAGKVLEAGVKLKKVMTGKGLTSAKAKCPLCEAGHLHGRLITGRAAGRHRSSGGAFRMWCDGCPAQMME